MQNSNSNRSPKWGSTTKITISLVIIAASAALLIRFSDLLNTLIAAFIFSVLFHPIARFIHQKIKISWPWSVSIVYLITLILIFGLILLGGIGFINQMEGLIQFLQNLLIEVPQFFDNLTTFKFNIGPFEFDFSYIDWNLVGNQLLSIVEPILAKTGVLLGNLATGTVGLLGSFLFSLLVSYLIIIETEGVKNRILKIEIPGYQYDFVRLSTRINIIWNEFLRGQALVFLARFTLYLVVLSVLRVRFVLGMAFLATLGNFIPYIGVAIVWIINFFVAFFQGTTILGLDPWLYSLIVMGVGWVLDNIYDSFFAPRIMANVLKLHPAAVLVGVLVGLNLFGLMGMFLAPPLLATIKVLFSYIEKKMKDLDPWTEEGEEKPEEEKWFVTKVFEKVTDGAKSLYQNISNNNEKKE